MKKLLRLDILGIIAGTLAIFMLPVIGITDIEVALLIYVLTIGTTYF